MQKILDGEVEVDFSNMTLTELENSREKLRNEISKISLDDKKNLVDFKLVLANVNHQILMRNLTGHKYHPSL